MDKLLHKKINLLVHLARVDGKFDLSERKFLNSLLEEHGLVKTYLYENDQINLEDMRDAPDQKELLYWSLKMMQADGVIHPDERAFCKALALKLGYQTKLIDSFAENFVISYTEFSSRAETFKIL